MRVGHLALATLAAERPDPRYFRLARRAISPDAPVTGSSPPRPPPLTLWAVATRRMQRHAVDFPRELAARFAGCARARGVTRSSLLHGWIITGARLAREGRIDHLPPPPRTGVPVAPLGATVQVFWTQGDLEFSECAQALEDVGLSVPALCRNVVRVYVAAAGDSLRMPWPGPWPLGG